MDGLRTEELSGMSKFFIHIDRHPNFRTIPRVLEYNIETIIIIWMEQKQFDIYLSSTGVILNILRQPNHCMLDWIDYKINKTSRTDNRENNIF